jgi:hypothetical protein
MDPSPPPANKNKAETGQCNLDKASINLNAIRDVCKTELIRLLSSIDGGTKAKKVFVIDSKLLGPLGLLVEPDFLKAQGMEKLFILAPTRIDVPSDTRHIVYITRPQVPFMNMAVDQIHALKEGNKTFTILVVPRTTVLCENVLEQEQLSHVVRLEPFHMDLIPFDVDVLSLELPQVIKENFVEGDSTSLYYVARALMKMQSMYGVIPLIKGKGVTSQQIATMMLKLRREMQLGLTQTEPPAISEVIIIDRLVDPITPMLTMLTYEGLVDEFFGLNTSSVELPTEMVIDPTTTKDKPLTQAEKMKKIKVPLNSNDAIFSDVRDLNFARVGPNLNEKAKIIEEYYKKRHEAHTVPALKAYIGQFADFQSRHKALRIHTNIVKILLNWTTDPQFHQQLEAEQTLLAEDANIETTIAFIEECINKQEPLVKVLRLLCLLSLCTGGLKEKQHAFFIKEIIQTYGFEYIFTLNHLNKLGFLRKQGEAKLGNWFNNIRRPMRLLVLDVNEKEPDDIAYTYSGYAPLSCRLVEYARHSSLAQIQAVAAAASSSSSSGLGGISSMMEGRSSSGGAGSTAGGAGSSQTSAGSSGASTKPRLGEDTIRDGWGLPRHLEEAVRSTPGPTFHVHQTFSSSTAAPLDDFDGQPKADVSLVVFVGGITYSEISALRYLEHKTLKSQKKLIILTTSIINGNSFLESVFEELVPRSDIVS